MRSAILWFGRKAIESRLRGESLVVPVRPRVKLFLALLIVAASAPWLAVVNGQTITEFPLPAPNSVPYAITAGPDGKLWFDEGGGGRIGTIDMTGAITEFSLPSTNGLPIGITVGPDANLWFTEFYGDRVGQMSMTGSTSSFTLTGGRKPYAILAGPDGYLWLTQLQYSLSRMSTTGVLTDFNIGTAIALAVGSDQAMWCTVEIPASVVKVTTDGTITTFPLSYGVYPFGITTGSDGNLWFVEYAANQIGRITVDGALTEFPIPTPNSGTRFIANGPDGNLWFAEYSTRKIGRISPNGTIAEFPLPVDVGGPWGIATGADDKLWFTNHASNSIGRLGPSSPPLPVPVPDGRFVRGTPLHAQRTGEAFTVSWDVKRCTSADYNLYAGHLGDFSQIANAVCGLGTTGVASGFTLPDDSWWVIAGVDSLGGSIGSFGRRDDGRETSLIGWGSGGACPNQTTQLIGRSCP